MIRAAIVLLSLFLLVGCGEELPTAIEPSPSPTPEPVPTPDPCVPIRVDIVAELKGKIVRDWGLGDNPSLTASIKFTGDSVGANTAACPQLSAVTWDVSTGPARCQIVGTRNSPTIYLKCETCGYETVFAYPAGFSVLPGISTFKIHCGT